MASQNHFTLSFPLKSPADAKALSEELPPMMPGLFQVEDAIGTIHYSRFTLLSDKTLLFLGDFDGEFSQLMADLAKHAGPVFDTVFKHVNSPPPTPVAENADAFAEWTAAHLLHPVNLYTAYPDVTAKEIKTLAAAADVTGAGELHPFLVILPMKSKLADIEVQLILMVRDTGQRRTSTKSGHRTSRSSCRSKTTKLVSSRSMTAHSTSTFPISPRTLDLSSIFYSSSPKAHRPRPAGSICRSLSTLRRERIALRLGSTRRIQV